MRIRTRRRISLHTRLAVLRSQGYTCQSCKEPGTFYDLQIDHIVPWSWNGGDDFENLQALCGPCNRRKGNRFIG